MGAASELVALKLIEASNARADKMGYDPAAGASAEVPADNVQRDTIGLYPLVALLRPVALRFQFHFEGTRGTNRLDKVCCKAHIRIRDSALMSITL